MILAIYFILFAVYYRQKSQIASSMALLIAFSALSGVLVGNAIEIDSFKSLFNLIFIIFIIHILISSFTKYRIDNFIIKTNPRKIKIVFNILLLASILSFVVNSYVFYKTINAGFEDFGAFKNSEIGGEFRYSLSIPHAFISLASFLSPSSFFMLGFAFYYFSNKNYKKAIFSFVLSLNMPLQGFTMFSRSWTITYFLLMIFYIILILPTIDKRTKNKLKLSIIGISVPLIIYLFEVTNNRFNLNDYVDINSKSLIQNGALYSTFDYFSQWLKNSIYVLSNYYNFESIQFGQSSNTLIPEISNIFGLIERENLLDARSKIWPSPYYYTFNGLVTELVFDFGYLGTILFAFLYKKIVNLLLPINRSINLYQLLNYGILVTLPLLSFTGNYLAVAFYNYAILYSALIGIYFYTRISNKAI